MKSFNKVAAQGELMIRKIADVPSKKLPIGYTALAAENGNLIVGHSETGHHHVIDADCAEIGVKEKTSAGMRILYAIVRDETKVEHLRPYDTHEPIALTPGDYEIRIGREYDQFAELIRQQAD